MTEFSSVTLESKQWVDSFVKAENSRSADFNFGNIYIWDKRYRQLIGHCEGRMLTKLRYDGKPAFVYPVGSGPVLPAISQLNEYARMKGYEFKLRGITEAQRERLEDELPGVFEYREDTECADYVYSIDKLADFAGKALHGKKNHCNRFEKEHNWSFRPLTRELIPTCLDMLQIWQETNAERLDPSIAAEHDAITRAFAAYETLGLEGGVLFAEDTIIGFTVGEFACDDTFDVHFEKAVRDINGAYTMVCREFARQLRNDHPGLLYLNREDDMGIDALRQSKLSYKPDFMVRKFTAEYKKS